MIEPSEGGEYNFKLYYAGYATVYIDGKKVVPTRWRTAWNPNSYKFAVDLQGGRCVPVRIEWQPDGDMSYCALQAMPPATAEERGRQSWWSEMSKQLDYYFHCRRQPRRSDKRLSHSYREIAHHAQVGHGLLAEPGTLHDAR